MSDTIKHYKAHWSVLLVTMTTLQTALCLGLAWFTMFRGSWWISLALLFLVAGCSLLSIRGYAITPDSILVQRLFWATRLPLKGLRSAQLGLAPSWQGIRIGNGGFFSFSGWRYNAELGFHRVFITDHRHTVILRYNNCIILVSPAEPNSFIRDLPILGGPA